MIENVIFDLGNVLIAFDLSVAERRLLAGGARLDDATRARMERLKHALEIGEMDPGDFVREAVRTIGFQGSHAEFVDIWQRIFTPIGPMFALVERLAARYPLFVLSNTNVLHADWFLAEYDIFRHFRDAIYSHEVGMAKPDHEIFRLAERRFGVAPERTLYLDDLPANVEAAAACGFRAIRYDLGRHEDLLGQLRDLGVAAEGDRREGP